MADQAQNYEDLELRLPINAIESLRQVADLAGVTLDQTIGVLLAVTVRRELGVLATTPRRYMVESVHGTFYTDDEALIETIRTMTEPEANWTVTDLTPRSPA